MPILILSYAIDPHVIAVKESLEKRGAQYVEYCFLDYPCNSLLGVELKQNSFNGELRINGNVYNLNDFSAVWHRKPLETKASPDIKRHLRKYVEEESEAFFSNLPCLFPNALFVSDPTHKNIGSNKLFQLLAARQIGLNIPDTFIGNNDKFFVKSICNNYDELLVKAFHKGYITLPFSLGKWLRKTFWNWRHHKKRKWLMFSNFSYDEGIGLYSKKVQSADYPQFIANIPVCPIIVQQYIQKNIELRITVVGKQIFACAIYSQEGSEKAKVDYRVELNNLRHKVFKLPLDIKDKCFALLKKMNLQYGCIDMILTPSGKYVFLEINTSGQWLWIEKETGLPITDAIADLLINRDGLS